MPVESCPLNVCQGCCPVPGCGRDSTRLDRHVKSHTHAGPAASRPPSSSEKPHASQQSEDSTLHYPDQVLALNNLLEEYRRHQEGPDPSYKLKQNVSGKISRIKKFIAFMSEGKTNLASLVFLNETARIHAWISSLRQAPMKETTVRHYAQNVAQFMDYIIETPPKSCRLTKQVLIGLWQEMQQVLKSMQRGVAMHQVTDRAMKEERVIPKATLLKCRELSRNRIPEILTALESGPSQKNLWRFYGHFSAFLASFYGHSGGVYTNMTIQEVEGARRATSETVGLHVIKVSSHRTNKTFGPAQIVLSHDEYKWAQRLLKIKDKLPGGKNAMYFFFTSKPNPCKNLNNYFQEAWKDMGLPGCPSFTDLRSSIARHAKVTHSSDDCRKMHIFMCLNVRTADKFYASNLTVEQAIEHRMWLQAVVNGEETPTSVKRKRPVTKASHPRKRAAPVSSSDLTSESTTLESDQDDPGELEDSAPQAEVQ